MLPAQGAKRSLGWRYALLPYLEQQSLFDLGATPAGKQAPERTALHTTVLPFFQCPATEGYARLIAAQGVPGGARDYYALHTSGGSYVSGMWCPLADETYGEGRTMERSSHWRTWPAPLRYTTDGLSNTMMIYESAARGAVMIRDGHVAGFDSSEFDRGWADIQLPWVYADTVLPLSVNERPINVSNISSMYAYHRGGVNALFGDGRVHFLSEATKADVVRALASREEGEASPWEPAQ
jgi:prepilin-type processing-associated H-X9-DG protein